MRNWCISIENIGGNGVLKTCTFHLKIGLRAEFYSSFHSNTLISVSALFLKPYNISSEPFSNITYWNFLDLKLNVPNHFRTFSATRNKIQTLNLQKRSKNGTSQHMQSCQRLRSSLSPSALARANSTAQELFNMDRQLEGI